MAKTIALGHFAVGRTWRWLMMFAALCASGWVVPLILHGSYAAAVSESRAGTLVPVAMIVSLIAGLIVLRVGATLLNAPSVALALKDGRVTYASRWLISFRIDQVEGVVLSSREREPDIVVHLAGGRRASIPTGLFVEPAEEIAERILFHASA